MTKRLLIAGLVASLLAACSHQKPRGDERYVNQANPQISVAGGRIVAPNALVFLEDKKNVTVTWQLPADSKYKFAENGIVIDGALTDDVLKGPRDSVVLNKGQTEIVECRRAKDGLEFTCLNRHTAPGIYKYTIRVVDEAQKQIMLDPAVVNM